MKSKEVDYKINDDHCRLLFTDIIDGQDIIGVTLYMDDCAYWCGSLLDIHETRKLIPHKDYQINATGITAAASILSAVIYAARHPNLGLLLPDDLDYKEYLRYVEPVLGPIVNKRIDIPDWDRIKNLQFEDFLVKTTI
jgi:homospermidine synthase